MCITYQWGLMAFTPIYDTTVVRWLNWQVRHCFSTCIATRNQSSVETEFTWFWYFLNCTWHDVPQPSCMLQNSGCRLIACGSGKSTLVSAVTVKSASLLVRSHLLLFWDINIYIFFCSPKEITETYSWEKRDIWNGMLMFDCEHKNLLMRRSLQIMHSGVSCSSNVNILGPSCSSNANALGPSYNRFILSG